MKNSLQRPRLERLDLDGVELAVRYSRRRTLGLYVHTDGRVEARVPLGCDPQLVRRFVTERRAWLARKRAEFAARPAPAARSYEDGSKHPFLGGRLLLRRVAGRPSGVWLRGEVVEVRDPQVERPARVEALLDRWYRRQAERVFRELLTARQRAMAPLGIPLPSLRIRAMRSRWGSCSSRGGVCLNLELIKYPPRLIDYVITHELCHLKEFNHGPGFYALMDAALPDWRERREELRRLAGEMPVD